MPSHHSLNTPSHYLLQQTYHIPSPELDPEGYDFPWPNLAVNLNSPVVSDLLHGTNWQPSTSSYEGIIFGRQAWPLISLPILFRTFGTDHETERNDPGVWKKKCTLSSTPLHQKRMFRARYMPKYPVRVIVRGGSIGGLRYRLSSEWSQGHHVSCLEHRRGRDLRG